MTKEDAFQKVYNHYHDMLKNETSKRDKLYLELEKATDQNKKEAKQKELEQTEENLKTIPKTAYFWSYSLLADQLKVSEEETKAFVLELVKENRLKQPFAHLQVFCLVK